MKIAIIHAGMDLVGGIERVISIQANYWVEEGHEVLLMTHRDPECKSFYKLDPRIRNIYTGGLPRKAILDKIPGVYPCRVIKTRIRQLRETIKKIKPDVIITTMHGSENYYLDKCVNDIPIIGVNHISYNLRIGTYKCSKLAKIKEWLLFRLQLRTFKHYGQIVTLSKTETYIWRNLGCQTTFIPNSIDTSIDNNYSPKGNKSIVTVGRLDYLKGFDRLLDVWEIVAGNFPDWTLVVIGDGPLKKEYEDRVHALGLDMQVKFLGNRSDVKSILANSSIFTFASRSESFGMVLLEALSCGLPVISFDCENGPRDIIDNYFNGFLVEDGNVKDFTDKLSLLMSNSLIYDNLCKNAKTTLLKFDHEIVMSQWNDLLKKVVFK